MDFNYSEWFAHYLQPWEMGVYQRQHLDGTRMYSKWDGRQWLAGASTVELAAKRTRPSRFTSLAWRGLGERVE